MNGAYRHLRIAILFNLHTNHLYEYDIQISICIFCQNKVYSKRVRRTLKNNLTKWLHVSPSQKFNLDQVHFKFNAS